MSAQQRADPVPETLLESNVLGVAQPPVGVQRRRVVGADIEHDMVAELEQVGRDGAGRRLRVAAPAELRLGQHVADDRDPRLTPDDVRPGGRDQPAVDPDPVVHALVRWPTAAATTRTRGGTAG